MNRVPCDWSRASSSFIKVTVALSLSGSLLAQYRGGYDWSTHGGDAQRSSWVRSDPKISTAALAGSDFQLLWKQKLGNEPLTAPVLLDRYIGYRGFRTYAFVGGAAEDAFGLDTDLGRIEWHKQLSPGVGGNNGNCPGGMAAEVTRPVSGSLPINVASRFGGGRGGPAKSGVGEPLEGAVTLAQVSANRPATAPPSPTLAASQTAGAPVRPPSGFAPRPTLLYALSGDGALHTMYVSNGEDAAPPIPFLASGAEVSDVSVVDGIAYAATVGNCGGASKGVWALDLTSKTVSKWTGAIVGTGPAFGPTAAYVTTGSKLVALEPKTLVAGAASYDAIQPFTTAPTVFEYKTKLLMAAATKDGVVHVVDTASPASAVAESSAGEAEPSELATWQTAAETRWLIASSAKSITTWKIVDQKGGLALQQGWSVHDLTSSAAALIINGVLFVLERGDRGHHAVVTAFDASTGKKLWNSGRSITSFVAKSGGLAAGGSALYLGTHDGTLWSFGFPIEH